MRKPDSQSRDTGKPETTDRRRVLLGLGLAGGSLVDGLLPGRAIADTAPSVAVDAPDADLEQRQPFYGLHQSGVTTARQASGLVVAFDVLATTRDDLRELFKGLTERIAFLTQGGPAQQIDPKYPPPDSNLLGPIVTPANLTMTVAVGASLFDDRFSLGALKPGQLIRMPEFPNDGLEEESCHGDLLIQICSDTPETNIHALRDIIKNFPGLLSVRWRVEGYNAPRRPSRTAPTPRNLLGFKDGTANPDISDDSAMDRVVWIGGETSEPAWAVGGTYKVVRIIRMFVERWDRTPLQEQQTIIGREKLSGAPLTMAVESDVPDYSKDLKGERIPLDAHIRLANPRVATTNGDPNLMLRRGYNYSRGVSRSGQLDMGLLFVCFQSNLENGFLAAQSRLNGEPLEEYIKPVGGGFYFVLPGVRAKGDYLAQSLFEGTERPG
jgi:deferrochelatase/peroxidase EfeB